MYKNYIFKECKHKNAYYMRDEGPLPGDQVFMTCSSEEKAKEWLHNLDFARLCDYIGRLCLLAPTIGPNCMIHAVGAYEIKGGGIDIVHHRIHCPEDFLSLAEICSSSRIRILFLEDNNLLAEDISTINILRIGIPEELQY